LVFFMCLIPSLGFARDFGVLIPAIHKGKFTSSVLYEHLKVRDDFDARGRAHFKSHAVGSQFTYGISDKLALSLKGGAFAEPEVESQGTTWKGRSGYLYGIDLYNEVFPATGYWPGVQASVGVSRFLVPLNQAIDPSGGVTLVNQRITGVDYHGSVLLSMKWARLWPYAGVRLFGRSVDWHDDQPAAGQLGQITGHAHGNASVVLGLPVRITDAIQFQAEAILVNQTTITAGLTIAVF
jgi:hypothetical protein